MKKLECLYCHGTCGCHEEGNKSMVGCTCPFNGPLVRFPKEDAYGLRFSFKIWKWGIEIWEKGWEL